jgi:hypothetical protein
MKLSETDHAKADRPGTPLHHAHMAVVKTTCTESPHRKCTESPHRAASRSTPACRTRCYSTAGYRWPQRLRGAGTPRVPAGAPTETVNLALHELEERKHICIRGGLEDLDLKPRMASRVTCLRTLLPGGAVSESVVRGRSRTGREVSPEELERWVASLPIEKADGRIHVRRLPPPESFCGSAPESMPTRLPAIRVENR